MIGFDFLLVLRPTSDIIFPLLIDIGRDFILELRSVNQENRRLRTGIKFIEQNEKDCGGMRTSQSLSKTTQAGRNGN